MLCRRWQVLRRSSRRLAWRPGRHHVAYSRTARAGRADRSSWGSPEDEGYVNREAVAVEVASGGCELGLVDREREVRLHEQYVAGEAEARERGGVGLGQRAGRIDAVTLADQLDGDRRAERELRGRDQTHRRDAVEAHRDARECGGLEIAFARVLGALVDGGIDLRCRDGDLRVQRRAQVGGIAIPF